MDVGGGRVGGYQNDQAKYRYFGSAKNIAVCHSFFSGFCAIAHLDTGTRYQRNNEKKALVPTQVSLT